MLWAKLPNEDGSVSDDVFARSLIEMLVDNLEELSEDTVGYAMDALRMMLYSVPTDLELRVDGSPPRPHPCARLPTHVPTLRLTRPVDRQVVSAEQTTSRHVNYIQISQTAKV